MKRRTVIAAVFAAVFVLSMGYSLWNYAANRDSFIISGVIEADDIHVGSRLGGRVLKVVAREGETVKAGEPMVLLEPDELNASLAEAEANLRQMEAKYAQLNTGYRTEEIAQAKSALEAARAKVRLNRAELDETVIKAPADALVETLDLESGDLVVAGEPIATLLRTGSLWVRAYLPETRLRFVRAGDKVSIHVESFPETTFNGVVRRIQRQGEVGPANTRSHEERMAQVFPTEVVIDDPDHVLRPGMSADVTISKATVRSQAKVREI